MTPRNGRRTIVHAPLGAIFMTPVSFGTTCCVVPAAGKLRRRVCTILKAAIGTAHDVVDSPAAVTATEPATVPATADGDSNCNGARDCWAVTVAVSSTSQQWQSPSL